MCLYECFLKIIAKLNKKLREIKEGSHSMDKIRVRVEKSLYDGTEKLAKKLFNEEGIESLVEESIYRLYCEFCSLSQNCQCPLRVYKQQV